LQRSAERTGRVALIALVVGALAWGLFALFEGPFASSWYRIRQHQLASEFSAPRAHSGRGAAIAILQVKSLGTNLVIAEGDSAGQLRSGPGHRIGTPMPGQIGNSVIVGHRHAWGGPLADIGQLKPGDPIAVQAGSLGGPIGVFTVQSVNQVRGDDVTPFAPSTDRRITIVAGTGGQFSDKRTVVVAISGKPGKLEAPTPATRATTAGGSLVWNGEVLLAVGSLLLAGGVFVLMRRRYRALPIAAVVTPLVLIAVLALLLNLDGALPPLR
jgi:sortase (surface protein transpeptidase)